MGEAEGEGEVEREGEGEGEGEEVVVVAGVVSAGLAGEVAREEEGEGGAGVVSGVVAMPTEKEAMTRSSESKVEPTAQGEG